MGWQVRGRESLRWALLAASALTVAACAPVAAVGPTTPTVEAPAKAAAPVWAQDISDLKADPAVRYGVLPNGMRYAVKRNTQPAGTAALRLRIEAGSLQEEPDQLGLAHFLEHMAFNGSKNVPEGEMIKILERKGLEFGPDTNAYTSFGETVYQLDLPNVQQDTIDTGFKLMRETTDRLLMEQGAIDRERGVILSEERARATPEFRILKGRYDFWLKGQLLPERFPIGDVNIIKTANRPRFVDFYQKYYRPERGLFVVVGDIDVDKVEAQIKATFADWAQPGVDGPDPSQGAVAPRGAEYLTLIEPQGPTNASIAYLGAPDLATDTRAERTRDWAQALAFAVVNRRLGKIARSADPPFIGAGVGVSNVEESAEILSLQVSAKPGAWAKAMSAGEQEWRRAITFGVTQSELDREIEEYRASMQQAATGADTRATPDLADGITGAVDDREVFTHPAEDLALFEAAVKGLTAETVSASLKQSFAGKHGPLVSVASSLPIAGGTDEVKAAFEASQKVAVTPPATETAKPWDYLSFGTPSAIVERREDKELGVTFVRFANGVRLNVKPTTFDKDEIGVRVRMSGGYASLPRTSPVYGWGMPFSVPEGGLGRFDREALDQALTGRVVGGAMSVGDDAFVLRGATRGADLELQMQLLTAYITDAGWRDQGLRRLQASFQNQVKQSANAPSRLVFRELPGILRSGDPRSTFPTLAQVEAANMAQYRALLEPLFKSAPLEVTIVGDTTVEAAIKAVDDTFGALPKRAESAPAPGLAAIPRFPAGRAEPILLQHEGRADQAMALIAFKGRDFSDFRKARAQILAREMMSLRLTDEVREKQGAAYSPGVFAEQSFVFPGYGFMAAFTETPPDQVDTFFTTANGIAAELREGRFDQDLIDRARKPLLEQLTNAKKTNGYWLGQLTDAQSNPRRLAALRTADAELASLTRDDVIAAAKELFVDANAIRIISTAKAR
jgi:zinc protease